MPLAPIKFRCPRCSQLLGAQPSKSGRTIRCPKCRAELIVPAGPEAAGNDDLEFGPFLDTPTSGEFRTLAGSDADFLNLGPVPSAAPQPAQEHEPVDTPPGSPPPPVGHWTSESVVVFDSPARISVRAESHGQGSDDVPIPRLFLTGGCLIALLAVGGAFTSGLLIGKYVWIGP
jgi:DNA-directed RNA polymerase subunit RPC12/RpoP